MTSDFFLEEADQWREEVWEMIRLRSDVKFYLLTKRPERIIDHLPSDWGDGYENVILNVTCENQRRADERLPLILKIPAKHKGISVTPMIGAVNLDKYLKTTAFEQVICGDENYDGKRPCHFEWVKALAEQCQKYQVSFCFIETGTNFVKDGRSYHLKGKRLQSRMAFKSAISFEGHKKPFLLCDALGLIIAEEDCYQPSYIENCKECGSRLICNGCSDCGKCCTRK